VVNIRHPISVYLLFDELVELFDQSSMLVMRSMRAIAILSIPSAMGEDCQRSGRRCEPGARTKAGTVSECEAPTTPSRMTISIRMNAIRAVRCIPPRVRFGAPRRYRHCDHADFTRFRRRCRDCPRDLSSIKELVDAYWRGGGMHLPRVCLHALRSWLADGTKLMMRRATPAATSPAENR
jgi:hypothetical protein